MQSLFQEIGGPGKFQTSSKYLKLKTYELNIRHEKTQIRDFCTNFSTTNIIYSGDKTCTV